MVGLEVRQCEVLNWVGNGRHRPRTRDSASRVRHWSSDVPIIGQQFFQTKGTATPTIAPQSAYPLPYSKSTVWTSGIVASGCYKRQNTLYEILISGQEYEFSYSECPHHVFQWISSKVEMQITLTLLYLPSNFGELSMHRLCKTSVSITVCPPIKIRTTTPYYIWLLFFFVLIKCR